MSKCYMCTHCQRQHPVPDLDVLLASIMYMLTRSSRHGSDSLSQAIVQHMQMLAKHPDCDSEMLKKAASRLARHWHDEKKAAQNPSSVRQNNTENPRTVH